MSWFRVIGRPGLRIRGVGRRLVGRWLRGSLELGEEGGGGRFLGVVGSRWFRSGWRTFASVGGGALSERDRSRSLSESAPAPRRDPQLRPRAIQPNTPALPRNIIHRRL